MLTSSTGPSGVGQRTKQRAAQAFENRFADFAEWAAGQQGTYYLGGTREEVTAKYFALAGRLDKQPDDAGSRFRMNAAGGIDKESEWPDTAALWHDLDQGGSMPPSDDQPSPSADNQFSSQIQVKCADSEWPRSVGSYQRDVAQARKEHPMFGPAAANINPCAFWPNHPVERPIEIDAGKGRPNVLILHNDRDPILPPIGAKEMDQALGERAALVQVDDGGHGIFLSNDNVCANNIITDFLVDRQFPAEHSRCPVTGPLESPPR